MKYRITAFSVHILISAILLLPIYLLLRYFWYPSIFFYTEGGIDGLILLAGVDFFIGPILTMLVYVPQKKGLKLDLAMIALLQTFCLVSGLAVVNHEKPLALIVADGTASTLNAQKLEMNKMAESEIHHLDGNTPRLIILDTPPNSAALKELRLASISGRKIHLQSEHYVPIETNLHLLDGQALNIDNLVELHKSSKKELISAIRGFQISEKDSDVLFVPYFSKAGLIYLVIRTKPTFSIGFANISPYLNHSYTHINQAPPSQ